jgi:hypothetical protein
LAEGIFMKAYSIFGAVCFLAAVLLSCVAGVYAANNFPSALVIAFAAGVALLVDVRGVAGRR